MGGGWQVTRMKEKCHQKRLLFSKLVSDQQRAGALVKRLKDSFKMTLLSIDRETSNFLWQENNLQRMSRSSITSNTCWELPINCQTFFSQCRKTKWTLLKCIVAYAMQWLKYWAVIHITIIPDQFPSYICIETWRSIHSGIAYLMQVNLVEYICHQFNPWLISFNLKAPLGHWHMVTDFIRGTLSTDYWIQSKKPCVKDSAPSTCRLHA